jgi:hypothetical protein
MQAIGGVVVRQWRSEVEGELARENAAPAKAELAQLTAEYVQARDGIDKGRARASMRSD